MGSSAPPAQVALEPGTRLDRYELLCVLAHGGMANVWLARVQGKLGFQKLFAVKTILPNVADDAVFKTMFLDEARIASRIEHPNVVHMLDVGEVSKVAYLVMDLVEGEPLHKLPRACQKRGTRMPLGVVLRILADACHGLHAAHELCDESGVPLGVVHRDMSPSNILVSAAGVSKVIDFGVAKARDRSSHQTTAGTLKGKISYMPREQALGRDVDRRADTWALGAVLYYLLAGRPPYKEEQQLATLQLAMTGAPIPPLPDSLPMSLRAAVSRALAHEPNQRFQTAAEMGEALESLMRKLGVVTTHTQVGAFVQEVLGDKLEARKQLIATALGEAGHRERTCAALTVAARESEPREDGSGSHSGAIIAIPTRLVNVQGLERSDITGPNLQAEHSTGSTGAAFVAAPIDVPRRRFLPALLAIAGVLAVVGMILIAFSIGASRRTDAATGAPASGAGTASAASTTSAASNASTATPADPTSTGASSAATAATAAAAATARAADAAANGTTAKATTKPITGPAPVAGPRPGGNTTAPAGTGKPKGREDYGF
jgi:serine/threonine-protein kinase